MPFYPFYGDLTTDRFPKPFAWQKGHSVKFGEESGFPTKQAGNDTRGFEFGHRFREKAKTA
jgi:hypothetical protein